MGSEQPVNTVECVLGVTQIVIWIL